MAKPPTTVKDKGRFWAISPASPSPGAQAPGSGFDLGWRAPSLHGPCCRCLCLESPIPLQWEDPVIFPMTPASGGRPPQGKKGAGQGERMAPPPHQAPPAERKRAAPTPAASSRPLQSAARPQLAWCLHTPITASITVPEAATGRNRGGRGLGGPGWSSPAGPGLAETGPGSRGSRCSEPFPS